VILSKTVDIPITNDSLDENKETVNLTLSSAGGSGALGAPATAVLTINDSALIQFHAATYTISEGAVNTPEGFASLTVQVDRSGDLSGAMREPDTAGFNDWVGVLNGCGPQQGFLGAPAGCDRAHISQGFFGATEFIDRGFLVYRLYDLGLNRLPLYTEFNADAAELRGFGLTAAEQQQNLDNYLLELGSRTEFVNRYAAVAATSQATQLIQLLETTAGVTLPATALPGQPPQFGRADLIDKRTTGQFSVVETVKTFVEQKVVYDKYFPRGFVTMQYFAYLRRDPDMAGWNDWVDVVVNGKPSEGITPGDYTHLIFGFIYSTEYRKRFGQP
jgi:hypothetical protein